MKISRREILEHYGLLPIGKSRPVALIDKRDTAWAQSIAWEAHPRFDGRSVARERKGARRYLHLLVAQRRLGARPSPGHVCEHLNGDLLDCRADNLKWSLKEKTAWRANAAAKAAANASA